MMTGIQRHIGEVLRFRLFSALFIIGAILFGVSASAQNETTSGNAGVILSLNGPVTPPVADYLAREIKNASDTNQELIIIEIDTPGGLVDSMKTIIKAILASDTPVATYVSPQGARSASAGLYIMYSAHISAMAPATNTGAATPVEIGGAPSEDSPFEDNDPGQQEDPAGGDLERVTNPEPSEGGTEAEALEDNTRDGTESVREAARDISPTGRAEDAPLSSPDALRAKIINDSVAYIRALAEERDRNADWAESAVREAASITSNKALEIGVIDMIATDIDDLLTQIDGQTITTASGDKVMATADLRLDRVEPTAAEKFLSFIANPNVAVILMSLATTGIIIEMWNPGSIFPGALGLTCLALGLYSFQVLPFNWLPLALMGIGAILIAVEAYSPTFGLAGLSGLGLFAGGMYFLFPESLRVSPSVIGTIVLMIGALLGLILFALIGSRSHGPMIGGEAVRKREGVVDDWDGSEGWVIVEGERWRARSSKPFSRGDKVRVVEVDGLVLVVKQAKAGSLLSALQPNEA